MRVMRRAPAFRFLLANHPPPVHGHAGLREGERQECADRKQRDQVIRDPAEQHK